MSTPARFYLMLSSATKINAIMFANCERPVLGGITNRFLTLAVRRHGLIPFCFALSDIKVQMSKRKFELTKIH